MKALCQLCGATVEAGPGAASLLETIQAPDTEPATRHQLELIVYDRLSAFMWLHISEHHQHQTEEGTLCQQRAAKMYAMNWADASADPGTDIQRLQRDWRAQMVLKLSTTTRYDDPAEPPAAAAVSSPSTGSTE